LTFHAACGCIVDIVIPARRRRAGATYCHAAEGGGVAIIKTLRNTL